MGIDDQRQVLPQFAVAGVAMALGRGIVDGAVHAPDLPVRPRAARFGRPVLDVEPLATPVERLPPADPRLGPRGPDLSLDVLGVAAAAVGFTHLH